MKKSWRKKIIFAYTARIVLMLNRNSTIILWILIELNIILFILMIQTKKEKMNRQNSLFYFIIQSIASLILLLRCFMETIINLGLTKEIFILALMLKIGLFPTHTWIYKISRYLSYTNLTILLTLQKLPLIFLFRENFTEITWIILFLSTITGSIILLKRNSIKEIIVSSSIYSTIWIILLVQIRIKTFLEIYLLYTICILIILKINEEKDLIKFSRKIIITVSMIFITALPPTRFIIFKIYAINLITPLISSTFIIIFWIATFAATIAYLKIIVLKIWVEKFFLNKNYNFNHRWENIKIFTISILVFFSTTIIY